MFKFVKLCSYEPMAANGQLMPALKFNLHYNVTTLHLGDLFAPWVAEYDFRYFDGRSLEPWLLSQIEHDARWFEALMAEAAKAVVKKIENSC